MLEAREQKGELLIRDLWQNGTDSVHGMRIVNIDSKSHSANKPESVYRRRSWRRRRCTWRIASKNVDNSLPWLPPSTGCWVWRRRLPWIGQPVALPQSGGNHTLGRADTSRVRSPSLWCGLHTGASGSPGWLKTRLVSISHSGKMAPRSTSSGKCAKRS